MAPGQSLLLYTDGADEALAPPLPEDGGEANNGELYGDARLADSFDLACRDLDHAGPEAIISRLREDLARHMKGRPLADDISLMVVTRSRQNGDEAKGEQAGA